MDTTYLSRIWCGLFTLHSLYQASQFLIQHAFNEGHSNLAASLRTPPMPGCQAARPFGDTYM